MAEKDEILEVSFTNPAFPLKVNSYASATGPISFAEFFSVFSSKIS